MQKHAHSLTAKLASMAIGDVIYLDDTPIRSRDREVKSCAVKRFPGSRFATMRCLIVTPDETLGRVVRVTRTL